MSSSPSFWDRATSPGPYHIIAYGTLLGSTVFQSFIGGIVAFKSLPRPQFATLQSNLFPIYFAMQTALPVALALTYPGSRGAPSSLTGVLSDENRWSALVPIATIFVTGAANMLWLGPKTTEVMRLRKHQETRDNKKAYDKGPHSPEMQKLNRQFGRLHGASTIVNLVGFVATIWYGFSLSDRIQ